MLRVYMADIAALDPGAALPFLSAARRERIERLQSPLGKKQGAGAELLLRYALGRLGIPALPEIRADENGKPRFIEGGPCFSLSHSGSWALCAVADREVGADIQERRACKEALVRRFFAPDERDAVLRAPDRDRAFTSVWARKESYAKALGLGLKLPMESFSVFALPSPWQIWCREAEAFCVAVCAGGDGGPEVFREIDASLLTIG